MKCKLPGTNVAEMLNNRTPLHLTNPTLFVMLCGTLSECKNMGIFPSHLVGNRLRLCQRGFSLKTQVLHKVKQD